MSKTLIFDILQYASELKAAGVPEKQAEVHAHKLAEIVDDNLVTKKDLDDALKDLEYRLTDKLTMRFGYMLENAN